MTHALPPGLTDCLLWSEELGMGFHPRPPMDYSGPYFEKYQVLDATPMGAALTQARIDLVRRHFTGQVVDIGIGGGRFVTESGAMGFDVNPEAVDWLRAQERYYDPYQHHAEAVTCWTAWSTFPSRRSCSTTLASGCSYRCRSTRIRPTAWPPNTTSRANIAGIGASLAWLPGASGRASNWWK